MWLRLLQAESAPERVLHRTNSYRIALGTVQFGLDYGVANQTGQVSADEVRAIVAAARKHGVTTLDTAISYGASEKVLGQVGIGDFEVISKLPAAPPDCTDLRGWVREQVLGSLGRLSVPYLQCLLFHRPEQLLSPLGPELLTAVLELRELGVISRIGISIYNPEELEPLLALMVFDLVQAPVNILDRRMITSGWLDRLQRLGVEVHARSLFLQGLLLMPASRRNGYFDTWSALLYRFDDWLQQHDITALQACTRFTLSQTALAKVVVGVDSCTHLLEILSASLGTVPALTDELMCDDVALLNPSLWRMK